MEKSLKTSIGSYIYKLLVFIYINSSLHFSAACSFRRQIPSLKASLKWIEYKSEKKFSKLQLTTSHPINQDGEIYQK